MSRKTRDLRELREEFAAMPYRERHIALRLAQEDLIIAEMLIPRCQSAGCGEFLGDPRGRGRKRKKCDSCGANDRQKAKREREAIPPLHKEIIERLKAKKPQDVREPMMCWCGCGRWLNPEKIERLINVDFNDASAHTVEYIQGYLESTHGPVKYNYRVPEEREVIFEVADTGPLLDGDAWEILIEGELSEVYGVACEVAIAEEFAHSAQRASRRDATGQSKHDEIVEYGGDNLRAVP